VLKLRKTRLKVVLVIAVLAGLVFSPTPIMGFIRPAHASTQPTIVSVAKPASISLANLNYGSPVRLRIPVIKVDAALDYVNLTPAGALDAPAGPNNAAWYDQGPRPGQTGDAVIDGHSGYKGNIPAVFDDLHELVAGDDIYVQDDKGATTTFVVNKVETYGQDQADLAVFRSTDGKAHLNLITCQGDWNQATQSYSDRLVVFADKI